MLQRPGIFVFSISGKQHFYLCWHTYLCSERGRAEDFRFIKRPPLEENCPDFQGFNTNKARITVQATKRKSKITFRQLTDQTPSEPLTILTSMVDAEKVTNAAGQKITVFTEDQQLYSVVLDIMWADHDRWIFFVPRLGGMHWLMSFVCSVGALLAGSGLKKILSSAFVGSDKMLLGKKLPMNLRAFTFVVIELLRGHVEEKGSYDEMEC